MAEKKAARSKTSQRFTADERAAMKERARELKAAGRGSKVDGEKDVLAKIAEGVHEGRRLASRT